MTVDTVDPSRVPLFIGYTASGTPLQATRINSIDDFTDAFGAAMHYLDRSLRLFYANGGGSAFVVSIGDGGNPTLADFQKSLPMLQTLRDAQVVAAPDAVLLNDGDHSAFVTELLDVCATMTSCFAVIDLREGELLGTSLQTPNGTFGAAYAPWLVTADGTNLPPSGAIAGIYASRNPWEPPANVTPSGIVDTTQRLDTDLMDSMLVEPNGLSVNPIFTFPGRGPTVWGARTLASMDGDEWRYIQIRRLIIYIEQSIKAALNQFAFSPNTPPTWESATQMIDAFLNELWEQGALIGPSPRDAYSVMIGLGSTMTQDDIANGYMNVNVAVAPVHPAEFIIISITQQLATT